MFSGWGRVGGLHLSALLLQQTAELQANKLHYHHCHQQQIPLQQIPAGHITSLTAQKHPHTHTSPHVCGCGSLLKSYGNRAQVIKVTKLETLLDRPARNQAAQLPTAPSLVP